MSGTERGVQQHPNVKLRYDSVTYVSYVPSPTLIFSGVISRGINTRGILWWQARVTLRVTPVRVTTLGQEQGYTVTEASMIWHREGVDRWGNVDDTLSLLPYILLLLRML